MTQQVVDLSVPLEKLPPWVWLLAVALLIVPPVPYVIVHGLDAALDNLNPLSLFVGGLVFIILHELAHGLGWKFAARLPWSAISFGFQWKTGSPYCHASVPMSVRPYRFGAALPLVLTGILPYLAGWLLTDSTLVMLGAIMISAAVGDIYILWTLREVPRHATVQDHESNAGCIVYLPQELADRPEAATR